MSGKTTMVFDQQGNLKIEETGFTGNACAQRTEQLIEGMGAKRKSENKKPEFHASVRDNGRTTIRR